MILFLLPLHSFCSDISNASQLHSIMQKITVLCQLLTATTDTIELQTIIQFMPYNKRNQCGVQFGDLVDLDEVSFTNHSHL